MPATNDLEIFIELHTILSGPVNEYPASKKDLDVVVAGFKLRLWFCLRDCLRSGDRTAAINLVRKIRRSVSRIKQPLLAHLHQATSDEMAAFSRDWKLRKETLARNGWPGSQFESETKIRAADGRGGLVRKSSLLIN